jgi:hypothetical protein
MLCHAIGGWNGQSDHDCGFLDAYRSLPRAGTRHLLLVGTEDVRDFSII